MGPGLLLLPIGLSVLFWAAYHYHKDRHLPEPPGHLVAAFLLGTLAAAISQGAYESLDWFGLRYDAGALAESNVAGLLAYSLLVIGPIEELAKLLPFAIVILRFDEFDEPIDGFIYASFVALGYSAIENWQYLEYLTPVEAAARGFASPVVHIVFASVWAFWITSAYLAGEAVMPAASVGLVIAAGLHGLYDFIVLLTPLSALPVAGLLILGLWIWRLILMRKMQAHASSERTLNSEEALTPR